MVNALDFGLDHIFVLDWNFVLLTHVELGSINLLQIVAIYQVNQFVVNCNSIPLKHLGVVNDCFAWQLCH